MSTNQGDRQGAARTIAGTGLPFNGDMLAMFEAEATIAEGQTFNGAMISWLQARLESTDDNINNLKQAFAESLSAYNWNGVGTFDALSTQQLILIDLTGLTTIVAGTPNNVAAAFDGVTNAATGSCMNGTTVAVGKTMASPKIFGRAILYGSNNDGFVQTDPADFTLEIRGKTGAAPTNFATDGSSLGSLTAADQADESAGRIVESTDLVNAWDHIWCRVTSPSGTEFLAELVLYEWGFL